MSTKRFVGVMATVGTALVLLGVGVVGAQEDGPVDEAENDYTGYEAGVMAEGREAGADGPLDWFADIKRQQDPPRGGEWEYGLWGGKARSYFDHPSECHGSTVMINGRKMRSVDTAAGHASVAEKWVLNKDDIRDEYYYRFC
ncbi:lactococcin 972 family bacteriocin [Corynebacterium lowii]|uniref:Bacteriocin n=1 Tax=Corynebacterium lowii TaxID=1544413 RepID=A0A0Q0UEG7_9CORY|nr:lactococcin 972 family bacteriocin [Corynebacterium lowii]KQB86263.1 Bacteriocin [Corynebacterium lowii]MDP9850748.1 hypothetical protein [Corynebacterium lowii]